MNLERPNFNPKPPTREQREPVKSEKEIAWEKKIAGVNEIADRLGKGIDEKIKKTVAAFLIHEFATDSSCEGHLADNKEEHGLPYPWVGIYAPEPEGWKGAEGDKKEQLNQEWRVKNFEQQQKMISFLEEFYKRRETPPDAKLVFNNIGIFGGFRIQSFGAKTVAMLTLEEQKQKLELYRKEIGDFTEFLKEKYFSK